MNTIFENSLVFPEALAVKLLAFGWQVHPKATFTANGACSLDFKTNAVMRRCDLREVHVGTVAGEVRRAIVAEREQVDGAVVDLSRRHG